MQQAELKYAFIFDHKAEFPVVFACRVLKVSTSGYYDWLVREESTRTKRKELLVVLIENIFNENYQIYGAPRITKSYKRGI